MWCQPRRIAPFSRPVLLTLPREDALADFSNHRVLWMVGRMAMGVRIGMELTAMARLWGLGRRKVEGVDYISKISSWPGSSRPRAPIAPPAASRATTEPWSRITWSDSAAAVRDHSWLSARPSSLTELARAVCHAGVQLDLKIPRSKSSAHCIHAELLASLFPLSFILP